MKKMKKWWSWQSKDEYAVKVSQLKLDLGVGLFGARSVADKLQVSIQITEGGTSSSTKKEKPPPSSTSSCFSLLFPLHRTSKPRRSCCTTTHATTSRTAKTTTLVWDTRDLRGFNLILKDGSLTSCSRHMLFHVLYYGEGAIGESKPQMTVVGKASMILPMADLLVMEEMKTQTINSHHQRNLPIRLKVNGLIIQSTLSVTLRFLKLRSSSCDDGNLAEYFENTVKSDKKCTSYLTSLARKNNNNDKFDEGGSSRYESDDCPVFDSDESSTESTTSSGSNSSTNSNSGIYITCTDSTDTFPSSETTTCPNLPRNRTYHHHACNFKTNATKRQAFQPPSTKSDELCPQLYLQGRASRWEMKEISSRDGQSKLKTNVFFASFDQRSEKASGGSACTVLVALIAHWLHSNKGMPTRAQFDTLITQGSLEWRNLCNNEYYSKLFPDKHFDLETVIEANLRHLTVLAQNSYTGFFSPEKFQCLKGAMSFDEIWDEIKSNKDDEPRIYIVSWNDHFFVLKVEADAYYIIDSLGERLFEGCQRGFILKFDDSCVMYGKLDEEEGTPLKRNSGVKSIEKGLENRLEIVCNGKECCKEFIKRFLAAIPLRQLENEEEKWNVPNPYLHRQLQIDFHFSSLLSSSSIMSFSTSGHLES